MSDGEIKAVKKPIKGAGWYEWVEFLKNCNLTIVHLA